MATFEHRRYPALIMHDGVREWARFAEEKRTFGEHTVRVGVLSTDDATVIARLRAATDPDLVEIGVDAEAPADANAVPDGAVSAVLAWVGDDKDKAAKALEAEQAKGERARSTIVATLEKLAAGDQ